MGATTVNDPVRDWLAARGGRWAAAVAWALFVVAASSIPALGRLPLGERGADKLVHFCAYLILGYLVRRALAPGGSGRYSPAVTGAALCTAWAMADELHQAVIPLRSPEALDFLADVAGSAAGIAVSHVRQGIEARLAKGDQDGDGP
jgi:VanZ family protein